MSDIDHGATTMTVGTDLVDIADVAASMEQFGRRYVERVYTAGERESCQGSDGPSADGLAERFAAKESVLKALRPTEGVAYHDIDVRVDSSGTPYVVLAGAIGAHAESVGLAGSSLSMSSDGGVASAVYLAVMTTPAPLPLPQPRK